VVHCFYFCSIMACWILFYSGSAGLCSILAVLGMCKSVLVKKAVQKRRWAVQKMAVEGWKKSLAQKMVWKGDKTSLTLFYYKKGRKTIISLCYWFLLTFFCLYRRTPLFLTSLFWKSFILKVCNALSRA